MDAETPRDPAASGANSPLPRAPAPGPGGLAARLAKPGDEAEAERLLLRGAAGASGSTSDADRARWALQAIVRNPLHGFVVLAESPAGRVVALAAVSTFLDPSRGWAGHLTAFPAGDPPLDPAARAWLLEETLEYARYHGVNRVVLGGAVPDLRGAAAEVELRPHFDESE